MFIRVIQYKDTDMNTDMQVDDTEVLTTEESYEVEYPLDTRLYDFLQNTYKDNTVRWVNIFQHLDGLNKIRHNKNVIFLDKVEERLLEIIIRTEDETSIPSELETYMLRSVQNYLEFYGITISLEHSNIYLVEDLLSAYVTIYNVDLPTTEDLSIQLGDSSIDPIERCVSILKDYFTYRESELYDMIEAVGEDWFEHLRVYFYAKIHRGIEQVNDEDIVAVRPLVLADRRFSATRAVQDTLYYGKSSYALETYLDKLYNDLDSYDNDMEAMAMEIVAANFLSYDQPIKDLSTLTEIINFKAIGNIPYKEALDNIAPRVLELIEAVKDRR